MKNYLKAILFFFVASVTLISCSSDDKNPPTAGFSLSDDNPIQYDEVTITSNPTAAENVTYAVTGGTFEINGNSSIQFLESGTYTVTQTVTNKDGSDSMDITVEVDQYNRFILDDQVTEITEAPFWVPANPDHYIFNDYIRFENPIAGGATVDLFKITPITGLTDPLEGTYTYSETPDKNTYEIVHTHNQEGFSYDWTTNGKEGADLVIQLIEDKGGADNIYDITISSFNLDYGNWDFATFTWVTEGNKTLEFHYRGVITAE